MSKPDFPARVRAAMTAEDHLRRVTKKHPRDIEGHCFWCHCEHDDPHDDDCPWVAAKAWVDAQIQPGESPLQWANRRVLEDVSRLAAGTSVPTRNTHQSEEPESPA